MKQAAIIAIGLCLWMLAVVGTFAGMRSLLSLAGVEDPNGPAAMLCAVTAIPWGIAIASAGFAALNKG